MVFLGLDVLAIVGTVPDHDVYSCSCWYLFVVCCSAVTRKRERSKKKRKKKKRNLSLFMGTKPPLSQTRFDCRTDPRSLLLVNRPRFTPPDGVEGVDVGRDLSGYGVVTTRKQNQCWYW